MLSNKELGAKIRAELKAVGIPARAVSVRVSDAGYSTAVRVKIKDISVEKAVVEKIVDRYEYIRRDERSGEVLEGCNTYVLVDYDYEVLRNASDKYMAQAQEIIDSNKEPGVGVEVATSADGSHLMYFFEAPGSIRNVVEICDKDGNYDYQNRYAAYNAFYLSQALALFNAVGHF